MNICMFIQRKSGVILTIFVFLLRVSDVALMEKGTWFNCFFYLLWLIAGELYLFCWIYVNLY